MTSIVPKRLGLARSARYGLPLLLCVALLAGAWNSQVAVGQTTSTAPSGAVKGDPYGPLGSTEFYPSADRPIGWRGDWTGRYVGATPPTTWARWAKTSIHDMRCLGPKPKDADGKGGDSLAFGRVENWLILGPVPVTLPADADNAPAPSTKPDKAAEDAAKALEAKINAKLLADEIIAKEADLAPDTGDKSKDLAWVAFKAGGENQHGGDGQSGVEFYRVLPKPTGTFASYAFTNIYSPADVKVTLKLHMPTAMKVWVNGKVVCSEPTAPWGNGKAVVIDLIRGWNKLLCKGIYKTPADPKAGVSFWRLTATLAPTDKAFAYETNNVAWMTPMPAASTSIPIIVDEKIFVTSLLADLLCINKADGKIIWMRSNNYADVMTDEEFAAAGGLKDQLAPDRENLKVMNDDVVKAINAAISPTGLPSDQYKALADKLAAKNKLERGIEDALIKAKVLKRASSSQHIGPANGTPVCDGKYVYAIFGGGIYSGPITVVCYDLDGKRIWARGFADVDAGEHGDHCSPAIADGKLVVQTVSFVRVLDAKTGADAWSWKIQGNGGNGGGSPTIVKIDGTSVIMGPRRDLIRLSDGKVLYIPPANVVGVSVTTPVINDGIVYHATGWFDPKSYSAFKLPQTMADKLDTAMLYQVSMDPVDKYKSFNFVNSLVSSPLYVDGFVYYLTEGGVLHVSDAATGKPAYVRALDEMRTRVQWVFNNGACGSPTQAGKLIYLTDDNGITVIIEPGREFKKVAVNTLENFDGNFVPEQTLSTPVFEGKFMYYRTPGYLYCIGAP